MRLDVLLGKRYLFFFSLLDGETINIPVGDTASETERHAWAWRFLWSPCAASSFHVSVGKGTKPAASHLWHETCEFVSPLIKHLRSHFLKDSSTVSPLSLICSFFSSCLLKPPLQIPSLLWLVSSHMPDPTLQTTTEQLCKNVYSYMCDMVT